MSSERRISPKGYSIAWRNTSGGWTAVLLAAPSNVRQLTDRDVRDWSPLVRQNGAFYLSMECKTCETDMYYGLVITTEEHQGMPVVPFDMAAQARFECGNCGGATEVGDYSDTVHEPGEIREDDAEVES